MNRSRVATVVCIPLTSNMKWADAPGNVSLTPRLTGLPQESVANVSQIITLDKSLLGEHVGKLPQTKLKVDSLWNRHRIGAIVAYPATEACNSKKAEREIWGQAALSQ